MKPNDAHCHFFSRNFVRTLARERGIPGNDLVGDACRILAWDPPGSNGELADRWVAELDRHQVGRAAIIGSVPEDETSVSEALGRHPGRFVGFFMVDPTRQTAAERVTRAVTELGLRCACLFPGMHGYELSDPRVLRLVDRLASVPGTALFIHCGVLTVGARKKLGLPARFDLRYSNPLNVHPLALAYPDLPFILPHFGAGMFREALMLGDLCPNVHLDTSSSNSWIRYSGLTLEQVFGRSLEILAPDRILFGTASSFFPRGWQSSLWEEQSRILRQVGLDRDGRRKIQSANFERLFPVNDSPVV